jgi:hypothetical protein
MRETAMRYGVTIAASVATLALLLSGVGQVSANVVYDNGAITWGGYYPITNEMELSDNFSVASPMVLTGALNIGLWVGTPNDPAPGPIHWAIGTSAFGSNTSSGVSTLSNTPIGQKWNHDRYVSSFAFDAPVTVQANTPYWLTLWLTTGVEEVGWDLNFASDHDAEYGHNFSLYSYSFRSPFQLEGGPAPEPSTLALLGIGVIGLLGYAWRPRKWAA